MQSRRARSITAACAIAALSLVNVSCKKPRTVIVVDIDTNAAMAAFPDIKVQCAYNWDGEDERDDIPGCTAEYTRGPGGAVSARVCLPGSISAIIDPAKDALPFTLVVSGANNRYRNIMTVTPVPEEYRLLRVRVHAACLAVSPASDAHPCPVLSGGSCTLSESCMWRDMTCGNQGTCVARAVARGNLEVIPRTGPPDAGLTEPVNGQCPLSSFGETDAGSDASMSQPDASSPDASSPDATADSSSNG
ncbi:MAG: hypothetical protein U0269_28090 [Polyangiales bacterium]